MDYEVWWVDEWDNDSDEPKGGAELLTKAPYLHMAETLLAPLARIRRHERGYGELVILDSAGHRHGEPYPVMAHQQTCAEVA